MTLVVSVFTVNFHISQYFWKAFNDCWCSSGFSPKIIVSSAYSKMNDLRRTEMSSSM